MDPPQQRLVLFSGDVIAGVEGDDGIEGVGGQVDLSCVAADKRSIGDIPPGAMTHPSTELRSSAARRMSMATARRRTSAPRQATTPGDVRRVDSSLVAL